MAKYINILQIRRIYWPAWREAEKTLMRNDHSKDEADEIRKDIHKAVTGSACSSKELTNRTLDAVVAKFAAISAPRDGKRQADLADQDCERVRFKIREIQARMSLDADYIETMAVNIARTAYKFCNEAQLKSILKALVYHENRQQKSGQA